MSAAAPLPDPNTLQTAFREHHDAVLRFVVRRVLDHHLAEDIASQVFTIAWRKLTPHDITRAWLLRTAHHLIGDALRRRDRERRLLEHLTDQAQPGHEHTLSEQLSNALANLPP